MNKSVAFLLGLVLSATSIVAQTQILNEDFQSGIPASWSVVVNDSYTLSPTVSEFSPGWIAIADPDNTADTVAASSSFFTTSGAASRWLISPALTLGTFGNYIKWRSKSYDGSYPDSYQVFVSTTDNQLTSFTDTLGLVQFELDEWTDYEVNLSDKGMDGKTIYVAFVLVTNGGFKLFLDDVNVRKDDPLTVVESKMNSEISVYPNPTSDCIYFSSLSIQQVILFDLSGKQLWKQSDASPISLKTLDSGVYLLQIQEVDGRMTTKRIQKR